MKLLIAVDMEGISGVVSWDHVTTGSSEWQRFRHLMTGDVNAAIAGAFNAGVSEVLVADGHARSDNILIEHLDQRAMLNCGSPSPFSMVQGVDQGVDIAFFIGYHARVGSQNAILDHTWSNTSVDNLWINDREVGEIGLNAAVCGHFNVPVLLISGDQTVAAEAQEWLPGIETVEVKKAVGRYAATCLPPAISQAKIQAAAERAVWSFQEGKSPLPLKVITPIKIKIAFKNSDMADRASILHNTKRIEGRCILFESSTMPEAYRTFRTLVGLAG
jgi:D-amino peptidase